MKFNSGQKHSQRMQNLFVGMSEILTNEKRDAIFEMQPSFAADLKLRKQVGDQSRDISAPRPGKRH
jgi:hypothetical protein